MESLFHFDHQILQALIKIFQRQPRQTEKNKTAVNFLVLIQNHATLEYQSKLIATLRSTASNQNYIETF